MMDQSPGIGERREASDRRKRLIVLLVLGVLGLIAGFFIGQNEEHGLLLDGGGTWPPSLVLTLAVAYLVAIFGASRVLRNSVDELQRDTLHKAAASAGTVFMVVYPIWFLLWKGGFTEEPIHGVLYLLFVVTSLAASLFYRFR